MSGEWSGTITGKRFVFASPSVDSVCVEDIARSLSMQCRFNGHVNRFYSIAEHSLYVAALAAHFAGTGRWQDLDEDEAYDAGLIHDCHEAYIGDMTRPIKREIPAIEDVEYRASRVVHLALGVDPNSPCRVGPVRRADDVALKIEAEHLIGVTGKDWPELLDIDVSQAHRDVVDSVSRSLGGFGVEWRVVEHVFHTELAHLLGKKKEELR